jgi:hypothetical protein
MYLSTNLRFFFQVTESFGANTREYSNILIDRHGTFVEIVPNKKPQVVKAVLEDRYIYTRGSHKIREPAADISTHKSLVLFFKDQKICGGGKEGIFWTTREYSPVL